MSRFEIFRVFSDLEGLHEAWRDRAEDLNRSRNEIGQIGKLQPGYAEKMLCDPPMKFAGRVSLPGMLKGTDSYLALVVDTNPAEGAIPAKQRKMRGGAVLLQKRLQAALLSDGASVGALKRDNISVKQEQDEGLARMQILGRLGGIKSGKTRRAKAERRKALQRIRSHAARKRWAKK